MELLCYIPHMEIIFNNTTPNKLKYWATHSAELKYFCKKSKRSM